MYFYNSKNRTTANNQYVNNMCNNYLIEILILELFSIIKIEKFVRIFVGVFRS